MSDQLGIPSTNNLPPSSESRHQKTGAEIAKTLIKIACGEGLIGRFAKDCLDDLHLRLVAINPTWTRRKIRTIYHNEAGSIHFHEIVDLIRVCAHDPESLDQALNTVIATFWEGLRI